ncbi:MAG: DUF4955 domain-containing protein [Cytophagales bacterium]|nr:DUF4955 domain-containing protein [Cytophagales bacterium]MDW8383483.1 DUF4955 domain-containing protein [Flammeovirgaceae bacterium]
MKLFIFLILFAIFSYAQKKQIPKILLEWEKNPNQSPLIDFSYAGYHQGKELPTRHYQAIGRTFYDVTNFGAIPNDGKDDIEAIQRAVDFVGQNGGGIITFPPGVFDFDVNTQKKFVVIRYSNVILSGYGENIDGTVLYDHSPSDYHDFSKKWLAGLFPSFFLISPLENDTSDYHPISNITNQLTSVASAKRGSTKLIVKNPEQLFIGQTYLLTQKSEDTSMVAEIVYPLPKDKISEGHLYIGNSTDAWGYKFQTLITIVDIQKNQVTIDAPLTWNIYEKYNPVIWKIPVIHESGIENFTLRTAWKEEFFHHKNPIHDNGWDAIRVRYAVNCWVRTIRFENVSSAVHFVSTKNCVVYDCRITGNPGHNGFVLSGASTYNLFYRLQGGQQMHTYSLNGFVSGNVISKSFSEEPSSIDSHGTLGIYNLFDNMHGCVMRSGGNQSVTSPLHGRGLVLWNIALGLLNPYNYRIVEDICNINQYPGLIAVGVYSPYHQPIYFIGEDGTRIYKDRKNNWAIIELHNQIINIPSLYEYQRAKRFKTNLY